MHAAGYILTVVIKDMIRRSQQKWMANESMIRVNAGLQALSDSLGIDKIASKEDIRKNLSEPGAYEKVKQQLETIRATISRELSSSILWKDCEVDCLTDIDRICSGILGGEYNQASDKTRDAVECNILNLLALSKELSNLAHRRVVDYVLIC